MRLILNIDVPDLVAAERFYVAAFGLAPARRLGDGALELTGAAVDIYLLQHAPGSAAAGTRSRDFARHWTPLHADVIVEHLDDALARALAAGARQEGAIREDAWGRIVQIADPFGHGWCLLQFSTHGYDAIAH